MVGASEHLPSSRGAGGGGHEVFLRHLSCWHLPGRDRVSGPEPPWTLPDLPPRHRLSQTGCPDLPMGSSNPGGKAQRILMRNYQDEATYTQVLDGHRPLGLSPSTGWLGEMQGRARGWEPCALTSSLGPNERLYRLQRCSLI